MKCYRIHVKHYLTFLPVKSFALKGLRLSSAFVKPGAMIMVPSGADSLYYPFCNI